MALSEAQWRYSIDPIIWWYFKDFEPIAGYVPEYPFPNLPKVASRARQFFGLDQHEKIKKALKRIDIEIEQYFSDLKLLAVNELTQKFLADRETYLDFFERNEDLQAGEKWVYRDEMDEDLDIPTARNTSEVDALKTIIDKRDSCFFLPEDADLPEPDHWPEGRTGDLFAALALKMIGSCISSASKNATYSIAIAGEYAIEAMDAICFAEKVRETEYLEAVHKKQLLAVTALQNSHFGELTAKLRQEWAAEHNAYEQSKRTRRSEEMNAARHQARKNAKQLVCQAWEIARNDFTSAEKAGNHYSTWLEEKSIGYQQKGKLTFYQPRAVTIWIRQHAREKGIRLR